jgi:hypothetical protein
MAGMSKCSPAAQAASTLSCSLRFAAKILLNYAQENQKCTGMEAGARSYRAMEGE